MLRTAAAILALSLSATALAQDDEEVYGLEETAYSAFRITQVRPDFDNLDPAINIGYTYGVYIPGLSWLAAEFDISQTIIPGENSGGGAFAKGLLPGGGGGDEGNGGNTTASGDDLAITSVAIFAAARSPGRYYGLARLGYRFLQSNIQEIDDESTGGAFGLGAGFRYGRTSALELTYTQYGSDLSYLSFVINY